MKTLTIERNSWHYKLALYGHLDADYDTDRTDLCRYFWALVRGIGKAPGLLVKQGYRSWKEKTCVIVNVQ